MNFLEAWRTRNRFSCADAGERIGISGAQFEIAETCGKIDAETQHALEGHFWRDIAELQRATKPAMGKITAEVSYYDTSRVKRGRHGGAP